jgi:hypothetical protein
MELNELIEKLKNPKKRNAYIEDEILPGSL